VCFIVRKIILEQGCAILISLYLAGEKTPTNRQKMVNNACLFAGKERDWSPCILGFESPCKTALEQGFLKYKHKREQSHKSNKQVCENDLNVKRKVLREFWRNNYLIWGYG
jgi:hypothetical protein